MVIVAGAPYYGLAKEREGAPSAFPRCSCPFFIIFPSISESVLISPTAISKSVLRGKTLAKEGGYKLENANV
jgi:hypothetical protein